MTSVLCKCKKRGSNRKRHRAWLAVLLQPPHRCPALFICAWTFIKIHASANTFWRYIQHNPKCLSCISLNIISNKCTWKATIWWHQIADEKHYYRLRPATFFPFQIYDDLSPFYLLAWITVTTGILRSRRLHHTISRFALTLSRTSRSWKGGIPRAGRLGLWRF